MFTLMIATVTVAFQNPSKIQIFHYILYLISKMHCNSIYLKYAQKILFKLINSRS